MFFRVRLAICLHRLSRGSRHFTGRPPKITANRQRRNAEIQTALFASGRLVPARARCDSLPFSRAAPNFLSPRERTKVRALGGRSSSPFPVDPSGWPQRFLRIGCEEDGIQNTLQVVVHLAIVESKGSNAVLVQLDCAIQIGQLCEVPAMARPVQLDGKMRFRAEKVDDAIPDRDLPAELQATELAIAELPPRRFSWRVAAFLRRRACWMIRVMAGPSPWSSP